MSSPLKNNTATIQELLDTINNLPEGGVDLPELTNAATASDLMEGKELIDGEGNVVTGTMPTATQATPSITVNSSGLITASATQSAGYVAAGTKSATKQLTTQAAKTITPSTSSQTAVASGRYTTGAVTVAAIPSSYVIPSGTSTITENGTYDVKNYASAVVNVASGGGGSIDTCTVTFESPDSIRVCSATCYVDGVITNVVQIFPGYTVTIDNVVCGSTIMAAVTYHDMYMATFTNGGNLLRHRYTGSEESSYYCQAPTTAGVSTTITIFDEDDI